MLCTSNHIYLVITIQNLTYVASTKESVYGVSEVTSPMSIPSALSSLSHQVVFWRQIIKLQNLTVGESKQQSPLTCFCSQKVGFAPMEYISALYCFLFVISQLVKKAPMENESNFPLGGDINLHTLLVLPILLGEKNLFELILLHTPSFYKIFRFPC